MNRSALHCEALMKRELVRRVESIAPIEVRPGDTLEVIHTTNITLEELGKEVGKVSEKVFEDTFDDTLTITNIILVNIYDDDEFVAVVVYLGGPKLTPEFLGLEWDPKPWKTILDGKVVEGKKWTTS